VRAWQRLTCPALPRAGGYGRERGGEQENLPSADVGWVLLPSAHRAAPSLWLLFPPSSSSVTTRAAVTPSGHPEEAPCSDPIESAVSWGIPGHETLAVVVGS
jgi:hypothetical protein